MARADGMAATTRDRQLVAIATAHLRGERDLVDALARDHLVDHPDNVLVAWIAGRSLNAVDRSRNAQFLDGSAREGSQRSPPGVPGGCSPSGARSSSCRSD